MKTKQDNKQNENKAKNKVFNNSIVNGLIFLVKSVVSQWKVLLTITITFIIIILALSSITMLIELTYPNSFNIDDGNLDKNHLTFGESFWWVYITISTIGYGDIYPITSGMRVWAIFISLIGISFVALYTAVVVNGFIQEFNKRIIEGEKAGAFGNISNISKEEKNEIRNTEIEELKKEIKTLKKENKTLKSKINK